MNNRYIHSLFTVLLTSVFLINSCKYNNNVEVRYNSFYKIDFSESINEKRNVLLSEIADTLIYVQLDNEKDALIGTVINAHLTKEYIFIQHSGSSLISQFSRDGSFIRNVGSIGRGPQEYLLARHFSINEKDRKIYIHTNWSRKILVYSFDGDYLKKIEFAGLDNGIYTWYKDNLFVGFSEPYIGNEVSVFTVVNDVGDTIQTIPNYNLWSKKYQTRGITSFIGRNVFYWFQNSLHMKGWYNDTVYCLTDNLHVKPKYYINLDSYQIPAQKNLRDPSQKYYWIGVNESASYIFINYGTFSLKSKEKGIMYYNKSSRILSALDNNSDQFGFINDLDSGPRFRPDFSNDSLSYFFINSIDFTAHLNLVPDFRNKLLLTGIISGSSHFNDENNDILIIAKLK